MMKKILTRLMLFLLFVSLISVANAQINTCDAYWEGYVFDKETQECKLTGASGCSNPFEFETKSECENANLPLQPCPSGCICNGNTIACPNEQQPTITTTVQSGTSSTSTQEETSATSTISISKTGTDGISIQSGNVEAVTSEKVSVTNSKLTMQTSTGASKEIKIMPEDVSEILGTSSIETIELKEESEIAVYSVTGTKKGKIIAVFPVEMKISAKVSAETGEIIFMEKPWWSFLAKEE